MTHTGEEKKKRWGRPSPLEEKAKDDEREKVCKRTLKKEEQKVVERQCKKKRKRRRIVFSKRKKTIPTSRVDGWGRGNEEDEESSLAMTERNQQKKIQRTCALGMQRGRGKFSSETRREGGQEVWYGEVSSLDFSSCSSFKSLFRTRLVPKQSCSGRRKKRKASFPPNGKIALKEVFSGEKR